jgi:hypothetical protein
MLLLIVSEKLKHWNFAFCIVQYELCCGTFVWSPLFSIATNL